MSDAFFLADDAIKGGSSSAAEDDSKEIKGWSCLLYTSDAADD